MSWKEVKLGELYTAYNGLSKSKKFFGTGDPFLTFSTVFNNYFLPRKLTEYVQSTIQEQQNYSICRGDVFITRTSEKSDELGLSCVALKDYPKATYNGFTKRLRPINPDCVVPEYIGYYMRMPAFRQEFQAFSTMTTRASLRNDDLLGLTVLLPNIKTQERIAGILRHYDFLIENNQKQIKLLEEAVQRLYKEWFIDLRFPGHENVEIVDGIPEGWNIRTLGDFKHRLESGSRPKGGIDSNLKDGIPSIGAENVIGLGKYNFSSEKLISKEFYENMNKGKLKDRDILIYKDGAYIGRTSLFQDDFPHSEASVNEHVFLLHMDDEVLQYYIFLTLYRHEYYLKMQNLNKNAAQPGINMKVLKTLDIIVPDEAIVAEFNDLVTPIIKTIFSKSKQIKMLTEARDRLLPKLMSGEIEV